MNTLREASEARVVFVPIEDKHLNAASRRGMALKRMFDRPPLRWLSNLARHFQPSLEVVCVKAGSD